MVINNHIVMNNIFGKISWVVLAVSCLCGVSSTVESSTPENIEYAPHALSSSPRTVKVAAFTVTSFQYVNANNEHVGYGYEYLSAVAQYANWNLEYVTGKYQELKKSLATGDGTVDIMNWINTPEDGLKLASFPCGNESTYLISLSGVHDDILFEDFDDIKKFKIGIDTSSNRNDDFYAYCQTFGFDPQEYDSVSGEGNLVFYDSTAKVTAAIKNGDVDLCLLSSMQNVAAHVVGKFGLSPFYFAVHDGDSELLQELNQALNSINVNDPTLADSLLQKYYGDSYNRINPSFTTEESDYINAHTVAMYYDPRWRPLSFLDDEGNFSGALSKIFALVSEKTGLKFNFIPMVDNDDAFAKIASGEMDCIAASPYDYALANKRNTSITSPYLSQTVEMATSKSVADPVGKVALVKDYYLAKKAIEFYSYTADDILYYDTITECLDAVISGEAAKTFLNSFQMEYYLRIRKYSSSLNFVNQYGVDFSTSVGVSKAIDDSDILLGIMSKGLASISMGEISSYLNSSEFYAENYTWIDFISSNLVMVSIIIVVFLVLLLVIIAMITVAVIKKQKQNRVLKEANLRDFLTGLGNKKSLSERIDSLMASKTPFAFCLIDIDDFKAINDTFGHNAGDVFLKKIGDAFTSVCQNEKAVPYRFAGDEFTILIEKDNKEDLTVFMNKVIDLAFHPMELDDGNYISFSFSAGASVYPVDQNNSKDLITAADSALYRIKKSSKNGYAFFNPELDSARMETVEIEKKLSSAVAGGKVRMVFQPIYDIHAKSFKAVEALMRITDFPYGPSIFIPAAERMGLINMLGRIAVEQAVNFLGSLKEEGITDCRVAVNFSGSQSSDRTFVDFLTKTLKAKSIPGTCFGLEFTETALVADPKDLKQVVNGCKDLGICLALDDFGTGFNSLQSLSSFKYDYIKFDSSTTKSMLTDGTADQLVSLVHSLGYQAVAEGIETKEDVDFVKGIGFDFIQGYYYSKPLEAEEAIAFIKKSRES